MSKPENNELQGSPCTLGMDCDEVGACYAKAQGDISQCGRADVSIRDRAIALYKPPFRFDTRGGYIWDAENNMVADNHTDPDDDAMLRVRGWGRISYMDDPEKLQDEVGAVIADALNAYWEQKQAQAERDARIAELEHALKGMLAIHDEPAGFVGKYGRALDEALDAQQVKIDKRIAVSRAALAKRGGDV